jgi:predicted nucleic acid-binding Zn ribbon protein
MPYQKKSLFDRKSNTSTVGEAIASLLEAYKLKGRFDEANLIASWESLMGKAIASRTKRIYFRNKVLCIEVSSAALRHELNMGKDKLKSRLTEAFGPGVFDEILLY